MGKCLITFLLWGILLPSFAKIDTLKLHRSIQSDLANHYYFWEDKNGNMDAYTAVAYFRNGKFKKYTQKRVFNSGFTDSKFWIILSVYNDSTSFLPLIWSLYNNNLNFSFYEITNEKKPILLDTIPSDRPLSMRKGVMRMPAYYFELKPKQSKLLLLHIEKENANIVYFPSNLDNPYELLMSESKQSFVIGRYIGYFFFVLIFNIIFGILLRRQIHIWHALYVLSIILYCSSEYMYDLYYFPNWFYILNNHLSRSFAISLAVFFGVIVMQIFTDQRKNYPRWWNLFKWYKIIVLSVCFIFAICSVWISFTWQGFKYIRIANDITMMIGLLLHLTYLIYSNINRNKFSLAYLIAEGLLILSYLDYISISLLKQRLLWIPPGNVINGLAVEVTLLTIFFVVNFFNERKQMFDNLKQKTSENQSLMTTLINAEENERIKIARELHDSLGPTLSTLRILISHSESEDKNKLLEIADRAIVESRNASHNIAAIDIVKNGLYESLRDLQFVLDTQTKTIFQFVFTGSDANISDKYSIQIYRIVNEAVQNILKHAKATRASIQLLTDKKTIQLIIEDNGIGMQESLAIKNGIGIKSIKARVHYLHGTIYIDSNNKGTTIIIEIPLTN